MDASDGTGCIICGFHNRVRIGKFRPKQSGCDKRFVVITKDVFTDFYCIASHSD